MYFISTEKRNKLASSKMCMMTWWHDDLMTCWHYDMMACWHVDMLTCWRVDLLTSWQEFKMKCWHLKIGHILRGLNTLLSMCGRTWSQKTRCQKITFGFAKHAKLLQCLDWLCCQSLKGQSEMDVQTIPIEAVRGMLTKDEIWLGGEEDAKWVSA